MPKQLISETRNLVQYNYDERYYTSLEKLKVNQN